MHMAARRRATSYRQSYGAASPRQMYVYGNTVRQPEYIPDRREVTRQPKKVSRQAKRNRKRAMQLDAAYVMFLGLAAVIAVFMCVQFLQLKSEIQMRSEHITALQEDLADITERNATAYNAATDSVNIEEIQKKAVNEMGMVYPTAGQVIEYESPDRDYVRQYDDIPENGVLAQSTDVSE